MAADFGLFVRCCHSATREGLAAALTLGRCRLEPAACDQPRSLHHSQNTVSGSQYIRCHPQHKLPLADRRLSNPFCAVSLESKRLLQCQTVGKSSWKIGFAVIDNPNSKKFATFRICNQQGTENSMATMNLSRCTFRRPCIAPRAAICSSQCRITRPASLQSQSTPSCTSLRSVTSSFAGKDIKPF